MNFQAAAQALAVGALSRPVFAPSSFAQTYPSQKRHRHRRIPGWRASPTSSPSGFHQPDVPLKQSVVTENRGGAGGAISPLRRRWPAPGAGRHVARDNIGSGRYNITASKNQGFEQNVDSRPGRLRRHQPRRDRGASEQSGQGPEMSSSPTPRPKASPAAAPAWHRPADRRRVFLPGGRQCEVCARAVPGGAPAITATLGNHVDALVLTLAAGGAANFQSGKLRGLGVASDKPEFGDPPMCRPMARWSPECHSVRGSASSRPPRRSDAVGTSSTPEINAVMQEPDSLEKLARPVSIRW